MTIITFICLLIIGGLLSGDAVLCWSLYLSLFVIGYIYMKVYDYVNTNPKWDYSLDNKTNRENGWKMLSEKKRIQIVNRYKQERIDLINSSLNNENVSERRKKELSTELDNIENLYNLDTPPREWIYSA